MDEFFGWAGKLLRVDLSTGAIYTEESSKYLPDYIGGKGIATKIAWDELETGVGPYDPENPIMFMNGPFAGTLAPTSGRGIVCSISPRVYPTPWFTYGGIGGNWSPELKFAGFDGAVIKGIAEKPVYLWICDGKAEIRDGAALWGKDTLTTQKLIKAECGEKTQVLCIGPAGENRVLFATIAHRLGNAVGNAGFGAVMGAKNLKAVAIRGTGGVKVANPTEFLSACREVSELIGAGPTSKVVASPAKPATMPCSYGCPHSCASMLKSIPAGLEADGGVNNVMAHCVNGYFQTGWERTEYPTEYTRDSYSGDITTRKVRGFDTDIGTELESLCDGLGMSGWNYINMYNWFWACIDNEVEEIDGCRLEPDNPRFWRELLHKIAFREGIGDALADDLVRASNKLNLPDVLKKHALFQEPMWGFAAHRQGRAVESQPSPIWIYTMLHWLMDSRDPLASHHQSSFIEYWFPPHHGGGSPDTDFKKVKATYAGVFGSGEVIAPGFDNIDDKTRATVWLDDRAQIKDSLLLCDWCFPRVVSGFRSIKELKAAEDYYGDVDAEAKMLTPLTGIDISTADLHISGERIKNLDRALHIRNYNRSREIDSTGEWYFEYPEKSDGSYLDKTTFDKILDSYYANRGWDKITGRPTRAKLEELGLKDVAAELRAATLPQ